MFDVEAITTIGLMLASWSPFWFKMVQMQFGYT
jgi:hypothetical protein